jgi:hypothetical protein
MLGEAEQVEFWDLIDEASKSMGFLGAAGNKLVVEDWKLWLSSMQVLASMNL